MSENALDELAHGAGPFAVDDAQVRQVAEHRIVERFEEFPFGLVEAKAAQGGRFRVLSVSVGGGDFLSDGDNECAQPWRGSLAGLLKTAAVEWRDGPLRLRCCEWRPTLPSVVRSKRRIKATAGDQAQDLCLAIGK